MKKPVIIFALCTLLFALGATLFAQTTTGSSLITQMKAAVHAFTLAGDLNPGVTGLESSPLVGKRTGDMLTAGEYNRILELVGQGGGGGGGGNLTTQVVSETCAAGRSSSCTATCPTGTVIVGGGVVWVATDGTCHISQSKSSGNGWTGSLSATNSSTNSCTAKVEAICASGGGGSTGGGAGWVDVPLTDTANFDQQCMYRFVTQGQTYYPETVHEDKLFWINNMHFTKTNKSVLVGGTAPYDRATKMEKFCGGGGGGGGFNWDACTPEWIGTPKNGTPYTNAAGLKCKYTGASGPGALDNTYYLCCPGA